MSNEPKVHLIGNAHLDPIWLWRRQEGCGEVLQTFRSALDRLNEYPDFVFTCSSASYYKSVEKIDPDMFAEIRARVKEGRWVPVNGWWVQPDCNMPSAESAARHARYSQRYYNENFGRICKTAYNVDSFGHSGMLPQIIKNGGMTAYVMMRPGAHENAEIPNMFMWESLDGTQIPTFHIPDASGYGSGNAEAINRSRDLAEKQINEEGHGMMIFYGVGNHGGGPTRGLIEYVQTQLKRDGYHDMVFSSPDAFFEAHCLEKVELPVWKDDLQHHASGCYSATSLVKQLNRKLENSLYFSEVFATVASKTAGMRDRTEDFKEAWLDVCFNQFHDILCGCSIMEAYDDVNASMGHALPISDRIQNEAFLRIARRIDTWIDGVSDPVCEVRGHSCGKFPRPVVVFNPLSFPVKAPVRTYHPSKQVTDDAGNDVIFSNVRSSRSNDSHLDTVFIADVPAMGYAVYWLKSCWDENEYQCPEYGRQCKQGRHYYNSRNLFDPHNASFYLAWIIAGAFAGLIAWINFTANVHNNENLLLVKLIYLIFGVDSGSPQITTLVEEYGSHLLFLPFYGLNIGFFLTFSLSLLTSHGRWLWKRTLQIIARSLIGGLFSYLSFFIGCVISIALYF